LNFNLQLIKVARFTIGCSKEQTFINISCNAIDKVLQNNYHNYILKQLTFLLTSICSTVVYCKGKSSTNDVEEQPSSISNHIFRVTSVVSLAESKDDVSLTSELLRPESHMQPIREASNLTLPPSRLSLRTEAIVEPALSVKRSDSTKINRLNSKDSKNMNGEDGDTSWWDDEFTRQQLNKAKSISAIDMLQQFKESGDLDKDLSQDNDIWHWLENKKDSGRSSPAEGTGRETPLEEKITVSDKLCFFHAVLTLSIIN